MAIPAERRSDTLKQLSYITPIQDELRMVEDVLSSELYSPVRTVTSVSYHILEAGGKRMRPALLLLSALACGNVWQPAAMARIAASTEMLHMATLMHDDVIDSADSRRGRPTANSVWGNQISVLAGDYMLARAFTILAAYGDLGLLNTVAGVATRMAEGEVSQIECHGDTDALTGVYLSIAHDKTAALISACCRMGAMMACGTPDQIESLSSYGMNLGMAFQITDDLLDIAGAPAITGKPIGGDIREGKITMPLILALEVAGPEDRDRLEGMIHGSEVNDADIEYARDLAARTGAIERTRDAAAGYVDQAVRNLWALRSSPAKDSLVELAEFITFRIR